MPIIIVIIIIIVIFIVIDHQFKLFYFFETIGYIPFFGTQKWINMVQSQSMGPCHIRRKASLAGPCVSLRSGLGMAEPFWGLHWNCLMCHPMIPIFGYGSIPIHTIFRGMNIHLPAILMFTRGIGFWPIPIWVNMPRLLTPILYNFMLGLLTSLSRWNDLMTWHAI